MRPGFWPGADDTLALLGLHTRAFAHGERDRFFRVRELELALHVRRLREELGGRFRVHHEAHPIERELQHAVWFAADPHDSLVAAARVLARVAVQQAVGSMYSFLPG